MIAYSVPSGPFRHLGVVAMAGLVFGSLFVGLVPDSPTADSLPSAPGLRLGLVALAVMCFLLAASLVREIPDPAGRIAGALALAAAGAWFAFDVAGLARLVTAGAGAGARSAFVLLEALALLIAGLAMIVLSHRLAASGATARRPF